MKIVYVIQCKEPGYFYIGITGNLKRRLWQHRTCRGSQFTRKYGVGEVIELIPNGSEYLTFLRYTLNPLVKWASMGNSTKLPTFNGATPQELPLTYEYISSYGADGFIAWDGLPNACRLRANRLVVS